MTEDDVSADEPPAGPTIKVVVPCKAGKSTLVAGLRQHGYRARSCCQEHSYVPDMWRRIVPADYLVFLDVTQPVVQKRAPRSDWGRELSRQRGRLVHARQHCDFYLHTDDLTPEDVVAQVIAFVKARQLWSAETVGTTPDHASI